MSIAAPAEEAREDAGSARRAKDARGTADAQVREVRERLSQGSTIKPEFEFELLSMFAKNELSASITLPLLALVFCLSSMFWASWMQAACWLTAVITAKFAMIVACRRFLASSRNAVRVGRWRRVFVWMEFVCGSAWAGIAALGLGTADPTSHVFLLAALIVLLAIRMTYTSVVMPILYAGTLPMTVAVVGRLLLQGEPFYYAMAAMAVVLHGYFIFLAQGLSKTALNMIEFRAEKDALIAEVEEEKWLCDEARRRAESANVAKSRFLATMSHELRTPLNAILGFSEVMICEVMGPMQNKAYKDYASNIHDSGKHLLQLINEILDLSRIEAGRYELHEEAVRLSDIAEDCLRLLHLRAESKGLKVVLEYPKGLELLWADERALRQISLNLISNALKFTPRGGEVTLTVQCEEDGGQTLTVRDNGPGIPADEMPKVMQAFGQGSLAHRTAEGGTGLGLPIVENLVTLHGGTFVLNSELGKGTEAVVRLPKRRVLRTVPPLQPLGQERHRKGSVAQAPQRRRPVRRPEETPAVAAHA